ncbi:MAG: exodeoxyribonuclease VII large subunit [Deltaproteobacteria bacterium]|nr:exodeoxyribonuclease VII large subunit [Deltaproteobacteria bacterium]
MSDADAPPIYSVGDVLRGVRSLLEDRVGRLWIAGEISNLARPRSGHVYFTLKGDGGQIRAALFRNEVRKLAFEPEDGLEVLAHADVTVYEARGDLQIIVRRLEPRGRGALQLAFEQLRRRLEAEGLFDPARKRPLPEIPRRVGVVTSITGAAVRDVIEVTGRRFPGAPLLIAPARVQGPGAEEEVAAALDALGETGDVDVILLVRGGGSLEDLQAFNTETLARAIARAPVPVVSGVGHDVDITIADLTADVRAPTPSAAAELALPDRAALASDLARDRRRLQRAGSTLLERLTARWERGRAALWAHAPSARLAAQRARFQVAARSLSRVAEARVTEARAVLGQLAARMDSLSPLAVLGRGYALVRRESDGAIVRRADQAPPGEVLSIRVAEAEIEAAVESTRPLDPAPAIK